MTRSLSRLALLALISTQILLAGGSWADSAQAESLQETLVGTWIFKPVPQIDGHVIVGAVAVTYDSDTKVFKGTAASDIRDKRTGNCVVKVGTVIWVIEEGSLTQGTSWGSQTTYWEGRIKSFWPPVKYFNWNATPDPSDSCPKAVEGESTLGVSAGDGKMAFEANAGTWEWLYLSKRFDAVCHADGGDSTARQATAELPSLQSPFWRNPTPQSSRLGGGTRLGAMRGLA